jgi:hypothetical protein
VKNWGSYCTCALVQLRASAFATKTQTTQPPSQFDRYLRTNIKAVMLRKVEAYINRAASKIENNLEDVPGRRCF